ncbi:hypothetical protein CYMTET_3673 [Cymbomonas tetramitiformis]|uniref:AB hydrolase-1 domain-containing protein n=1 Tax=Cymbomonas tetramitiformis TaxID=36881 RepID=A0AAE0H2K6_9CHLO|nr:hypothetical protein CYMTET_3673 [Cymbomonas tetramitiformis]|eukprot:gene1507-2140_t
MSFSEAWSWEDVFPAIFQPTPLEFADDPGRTLRHLHSLDLYTFYLQVSSNGANEEVLCVCRFPRKPGDEARRAAHVTRANVLDMIREAKGTPVALYAHGNAESVHTSFAVSEFVQENLDSIYVSFEWRGYGMDESKKPRFDAQSDRCAALLRFVSSDVGCLVLRNPVILIGYSLGCAVLLDAVEKRRRALSDAGNDVLSHRLVVTILLAPFLSAAALVVTPSFLTDVVTHIFPPMNNARAIRSLRSDVFVVHGTGDDVIPSKHSPKLLEVFQSSVGNLPHRARLLFLRDAKHNTLLAGTNRLRVAMELQQFMSAR